MHPALVIVPALALIFGPRWWVGRVLKQHNRRDLPSARSAGELARELLDSNRLQGVRVERTDIGDHYDPVAKAVRLGSDKIDRRTLTALTTAAHEVSHALQDASRYGPFVWRTRFNKVAQYAGEVGGVLFLAVPLSAILSRQPLPPIAIGSAALAMLGTGVIVQLAALPSELDASFNRALPMLRDRYLDERQAQDARKILWACSLTYIASSLVAVLHVWPWIGPSPVGLTMKRSPDCSRGKTLVPAARASRSAHRAAVSPSGVRRPRERNRNPLLEGLIRPVGKPLIRLWLSAREGRI